MLRVIGPALKGPPGDGEKAPPEEVLATVRLRELLGTGESCTVIAPDATPAGRFSLAGAKLREPEVAAGVENAVRP